MSESIIDRIEKDELVEVEFTATIKILRLADIFESEAEGNLEQAIQNIIGHTGASVIEAEEL
jgi:hypothetical protein